MRCRTAEPGAEKQADWLEAPEQVQRERQAARVHVLPVLLNLLNHHRKGIPVPPADAVQVRVQERAPVFHMNFCSSVLPEPALWVRIRAEDYFLRVWMCLLCG